MMPCESLAAFICILVERGALVHTYSPAAAREQSIRKRRSPSIKIKGDAASQHAVFAPLRREGKAEQHRRQKQKLKAQCVQIEGHCSPSRKSEAQSRYSSSRLYSDASTVTRALALRCSGSSRRFISFARRAHSQLSAEPSA